MVRSKNETWRQVWLCGLNCYSAADADADADALRNVMDVHFYLTWTYITLLQIFFVER